MRRAAQGGASAPVGEPVLPGNDRFDYESLDAGRGLLFIAHLGAARSARPWPRRLPGRRHVHALAVRTAAWATGAVPISECADEQSAPRVAKAEPADERLARRAQVTDCVETSGSAE